MLCPTHSCTPAPAVGGRGTFTVSLCSCAWYGVSHGWTRALCSLSDWLLSLNDVLLRVLHVFSGLVACFELWNVFPCTVILCSDDWHIGCFPVLTIMNKAAVNIMCGLLCERKFSTPLGKYQGVGLLDPMVKVCLVCKKLPACLPEWLHRCACPSVIPGHTLTSRWRCHCSGVWPSS